MMQYLYYIMYVTASCRSLALVKVILKFVGLLWYYYFYTLGIPYYYCYYYL